MPKIIYTYDLNKEWSLIVTRSLLEEMSQVATASGWGFRDCELRTKNSGSIACIALSDLAQIPAHLLETVTEMKLTFHRPAPASEYAFVTLENYWPFGGRHAFSLHLSSSDEGAVLGLRNAFASLVRLRRQWYSFLSTAKPYWAAILLQPILTIVQGVIQMKTRQAAIVPRLLDNGLFVSELVAGLMMFLRLRLFPANDFNLLDPPAALTSAARLRAKAAEGLKYVLGAAVLTIIGWAIKRALGS